MTNLVEKLRKQAEEFAEGRRIAEFGPAGGNPDARAEQHLEWKAADEIVRLREVIYEAVSCIRGGRLDQDNLVETLSDALYEEEDAQWP